MFELVVLLFEGDAVDLAVHVVGHDVDAGDDVGEHVLGQAVLDQVDDVQLVAAGRGVIEDDLVLLAVVDAGGIGHVVEGVDGDLDFAQLDAVAVVLDLEVLAGDEFQFAAAVVLDDVARAVDLILVQVVKGILHEGLAGLLLIIIVAECHARASHAQFARLVDVHESVLVVEDEHLHVLAGASDGNVLVVVEVAVHDIVGAIDGDLGGSVQVDEPGAGQFGHPHLQLLGGHCLAGKEDAAQVLRHIVVEDVAVAHEHDGRCGPQDGGDAALVEQLDEQLGEGEVFLADDVERGTGLEADVDILDRAVEVEGRLVAQGVGLVKAEAADEPLCQVDDAAMADDHPFRHSRRAAGEDGIQGVGVDDLVVDAVEQGLVALVSDGLLIVDDRAVEADGLQGLGITGCDRDGGDGVEHLGDETDAGFGHLVVDGHIEIAALDHAHKAHQALHLAVDEHQHGPAHRARESRYRGANGTGHGVPLGKSDSRLVVGKRHLIGETACRVV